jgi:hypothetical protein
MSDLHSMVTGTHDILLGMEDLMTTAQGLSPSSSRSTNRITGTKSTPTKIEPGILCEVNGLKSDAGKTLNGRRCAVIRYVEDECR